MRVAVIGAGIAGLTVARGLAQRDLDVNVFDKARGVGGRTSTRRRDSDRFDHGAQYFTCRSREFRRQVDDWCHRGVASSWIAPVRSLEGGALFESRAEVDRFVGLPGMSALARDLASGLEVECDRRVESIERSSSGYRLVLADGPVIDRFDCVVVATPAAQAVPLLSPAPGLATRARSVEMDPCHAVMVTFAEPLDLDLGGAFVTDSPLSWVASNASKPGRPDAECWVLHSSAAWSAEHVDDSAQGVAGDLIRAFARALGRELPHVIHQATHRWLLARARKPLGTAFLWDADAGIGVCGDWLIGTRVEDAFTSGHALANAVNGA